jgi:hypothetical protein
MAANPPIVVKSMGTSLTVDDQAITHRSLGKVMTTFPRGMLIDVKVKMLAAPIMGHGGSWNVTFFSASGEKITYPVRDRALVDQLAALTAQPAAQALQPAGAGVPAQQAAPQQVTREYKGNKEMLAGVQQMQRAGWRVVSQTGYQPGAGVGRVLALGVVGAAVFKPGAKFIVTFER